LINVICAIHQEEITWSAQVNEASKIYKELLEINYDDHFVRFGDIEQLSQISQQFPTRERFLTELTLDPPQSSGDLSGPALIDDDFLILSTVHSAKGQEWNNVHILNVADGNFPNEYAAGAYFCQL
jgi:DNA helicase-2/ATP-dependent DNA helicase PcrA